MKILLTGGGTGGHFYPVIAVAQALRKSAKENKLIDMELYYMAPQPYDKGLLYENSIIFVKNTAGKIRRYFSILNIVDFLKNIFGAIHAIWQIYWLYPDVIFGKGGYVSFPALFAGWFLRIPVIIHESDTVPGKVNKWAGKFAKRIAVSYAEAAQFFPKDRVAFTGNPVRQELMFPVKDGSREFFHLEKDLPVILVLGGSLGSQIINQTLIDALPKLVEKYQIIHQTGRNNFHLVKTTANAVLLTNKYQSRYLPLEALDSLNLRMAAGAADLIVSRAGSTVFEIGIWGVPSIIIPISDSNSDHQRKNAYSYARSGAAVVIEEANLTPNLLQSEIDRLIGSEAERNRMREAAKKFARTDSADLIAREIVDICLEHER